MRRRAALAGLLPLLALGLWLALARPGSGATGPCTLPGRASRAPAPGRAVPRLGRVVVVVLENEDCGDVVGGRSAPYLTSLARRSAFAERLFAIRHPSLPNYLALTGGSTFGIDSDCTDCTVRGRNLVDQLESARISWKAYMEGLPEPCFPGSGSGDYAKKHDPFLYYADVAASRARCSHVVPLTQLAADLRSHRLPRFSWITPNLCHDMHDCGVAAGDAFLARLLPPILRSLGPHGLLVVTWDEGTTGAGCCGLASGGNVATILAGPAARRGVRSTQRYDDYSILRTIEDGFRLPRLGGAACRCTQPLTPLLVR